MEEDEELLCRFGTPLEPLEEDEIPSKKPIQIEDQIVTDENGRRRFHGAFTGGFSAGFWNTVGSLEGWHPKEFKSSRAEKAELHKQKPSDFMDDEDIGEFGIAPQRVQTTEDFTPQDNKIGQKRKVQQQKITDGPIPGMPVLQQLLRPAKDMVAIRLLKKMGWKQGQGIGARQTRKEKKTTAKRNAREQYIMQMYGCDIGSISNKQNDYDSESDLSDSEEITFAPDDFQPYVCAIKDNTFGLGYTGLCRDPVLKNQHVNLFGPLEILDKDNKKLSIRGQAFGVGALEEEDEDIYQHDDITKYDFTLGNTRKNMKISNHKQIKNQESFVIDGFNSSSIENNKNNKKIFKISMPDSYTPRDWLKRRTRFEPLDDNRAEKLKKMEEYKYKGLGRHDLKPNERGHILGETSTNKPIEKYETIDENEVKIVQQKKTYLEKINEKYKNREEINIKKRNDVLDMLTSKFDKFTKTEIIKGDGTIEKQSDLSKDEIIDENIKNENDKIQNEANKITSKLDKTAGVFKPFLSDDLKQERYEKFLAENLQTDNEIKKFLLTIQPIHMSEWDREIEKKEFLQSQKIYKPLKGMMKERFVPESIIIAEREIKQVAKECNEKLTTLRTKKMWKPCSELCKRFNIAEPFGGTMIEEKIIKKTKYSVFDYLETSINDKNTFITPVIIPMKKIEIPKSKIQQQQSQKRISSKDLFTNELKINNKKSEDSILNNDKKYITKNDEIINSQTKYDTTRRKRSTTIEKSKIDKPKTDLERKIEETKDYHPSEKKDLFKSIFDSSSEDENDQEKVEKIDTAKSIEIPNDILTILTKPTSELNKLRNNAPLKMSADITDFRKPDENICTSVASISVATKSITEEIVQPPQKIIFKSKKQRLADEIAQSKEIVESKESPQSKETVESKESPQSKETVESKESPQSKETVESKESQQSIGTDKSKDCVEPTNYNINPEDRLESKIIDNENIYGPKIPIGSLKIMQSELVKEEYVKPKIDVDEKLSNILKKHKRTKIIEEWVEKTDEHLTIMSNDNSRKKKKKDKERDKNKKSKKHKKDKKHKK